MNVVSEPVGFIDVVMNVFFAFFGVFLGVLKG